MRTARPHRSQVDLYVTRLEPPIRDLLEEVRGIVREAAPGAEEEIKWGNPCYVQQGLVCYISAARSHVNLGFFRAEGLEDPEGLLEWDGWEMRHVRPLR